METCMGRPVLRNSPPRMGKSKQLVEDAFREIYTDEPSTVTRANVTGEKKRKMMVAIALSKARKRGAKIP